MSDCVSSRLAIPPPDQSCSGIRGACLCNIGLTCLECGNPRDRSSENRTCPSGCHVIGSVKRFKEIHDNCLCHRGGNPDNTARKCNGYKNTCTCAAMYNYDLCECCTRSQTNRPTVYFPYTLPSVRKDHYSQVSGASKARHDAIHVMHAWHLLAMGFVSVHLPGVLPDGLDTLPHQPTKIISGYLEGTMPPPRVNGKWLPDSLTQWCSTTNGHYIRKEKEKEKEEEEPWSLLPLFLSFFSF
jgi:hypothetical protein